MQKRERISSSLVYSHFLFFARLVTTLWRSTTIVQAANSICSCCSFEQQIEFRWRFRVTSGKYCYFVQHMFLSPTTILAVYFVDQPFPYTSIYYYSINTRFSIIISRTTRYISTHFRNTLIQTIRSGKSLILIFPIFNDKKNLKI